MGGLCCHRHHLRPYRDHLRLRMTDWLIDPAQSSAWLPRSSNRLVEPDLHRRACGFFRHLQRAYERRAVEPIVLAYRRFEPWLGPHRARLALTRRAEDADVDYVNDHVVIGADHVVRFDLRAPVGAGQLPIPPAGDDRPLDARPFEGSDGARDDVAHDERC